MLKSGIFLFVTKAQSHEKTLVLVPFRVFVAKMRGLFSK